MEPRYIVTEEQRPSGKRYIYVVPEGPTLRNERFLAGPFDKRTAEAMKAMYEADYRTPEKVARDD